MNPFTPNKQDEIATHEAMTNSAQDPTRLIGGSHLNTTFQSHFNPSPFFSSNYFYFAFLPFLSPTFLPPSKISPPNSGEFYKSFLFYLPPNSGGFWFII